MIKPEHIERLHSQAEFDRFLGDLDEESDRGAVLSAACMLELQLTRCIEAMLSNGPKNATGRLLRTDGPLGNLATKIDLLCCLGGIDEFEYKALHLVRKLRNDFAHDLMVDFTAGPISDRSMELAAHVLQEIASDTHRKLIAKGARPCFTVAVFILVDMLGMRPVLISAMSDSLKHDFAKMNRELTAIDEQDESTDP